MNVTGQLEDHQARCLPHLLTLRMMARDTAEAPLPWLAVAEVTRATEAILAEVEAAVRAVTGAGPGTGIFLDVRLQPARGRGRRRHRRGPGGGLYPAAPSTAPVRDADVGDLGGAGSVSPTGQDPTSDKIDGQVLGNLPDSALGPDGAGRPRSPSTVTVPAVTLEQAGELADSRRLPSADRGGPYPDPERAGLGFDPRVQAEVVQALDLAVVVDRPGAAVH